MLEKTFAMLAQHASGSPLPAGTPCFDETEIEAFGRALSGLVYAPPQLRRRLQAMGATVTRADYYSEIPTVDELEASLAKPSRLKLDEPFRDAVFLQDFLQDLTPFAADFDPPATEGRPDEFTWASGGFGYSDAMAYYAMIRRYRPRTIIELGCGVSTLIASLACERNGVGRVIAIEPYPAAFLRDLPRVELVQTRAQDLDEDMIDANLGDGDFLFIDTTHTVKNDSDCLHIYLRVLPAIRRRIMVHVHDVYLPEPLPTYMMLDHQIYWNEQYLLYAYLLGNVRTRTLYGSAYHHRTNPDLLGGLMYGRFAHGGASFWFEQAAPVEKGR